MSEEINQETTEADSTQTEQPVEASQTDEANNPASSVSSNSDAETAEQTSTDNAAESQTEWDARASHEALQKNYEQISKSYNELRREFTRRTQNESALQKKIDSLTDIINKATKKPIDPKQFFNDLQTQGPKAFEPLFQEREQALEQKFQQQIQEQQAQNEVLQYDLAKMERRMNPEMYPDFQKLEPIMADLVQDERVSLDFSQGAGAVMDTLYKLARSLNADKAVQDARSLGKREAESQAAKEAKARVAGGGKAGSVTDPTKMSLEDHRKMLIDRIGLAEDNG